MNPVRFHMKAAVHHLAEACNENDGEIGDPWKVLNMKQDLQYELLALNDYHDPEDEHAP